MTFPFAGFRPQTAQVPPSTGLWGWWYANGGAYTETSGTPTTLISADGTAIGSLKDQSGNGRHLYQATVGQKPTYKTNILNGLAIARHATASSQFLHSNAVVPAQTISFYVVFYPSTWANLRGIVSNDNGAPQLLLNQNTNSGGVSPQVGLFNGGYAALSSQANLTAWHLAAAIMTAAPLNTLRIDNNSDSSGTPAGGGSAGTQVEIGANSGNAGYFDGDIAEVLIYSATTHTTTSGDGLLARRYLNNKYALGMSF